jgi:hypothetical protein
MEASDKNIILDRNAVEGLLNLPVLEPLHLAGIIGTEEQCHPWRFRVGIPSHPTLPPPPSFEMPFLRIWDYYSGSKPDDDNNCMLSRAPRQRLDTAESRIDSLATHIDNEIWEPTPFISFTTSAAAVGKLANMRAPRRGAQTLTVVDPNVRLAAGLPVLDVLAEMEHYRITDPYDKDGEYYRDHYVCLWKVSAREIVGHWEWSELAASGDWYDEIVMPAFRAFRNKHTPGRVSSDGLRDLLGGMGKLSGGGSCSFIAFCQLTRAISCKQAAHADEPLCGGFGRIKSCRSLRGRICLG